jgi:uncharacterized membrane protein
MTRVYVFWNGRSEKTKIGSMVSAALVSTLVGLAASNIGIIPYEAPAYSVVLEFMLPLTVPLLLFRADLRSVIRSTGTLLLAFLLGSGIVLGIINLLLHSAKTISRFCLCQYLNVKIIVGLFQ